MKNSYVIFKLKGSTCFYTFLNGNKLVTRFEKHSKLKEVPGKVVQADSESFGQFQVRIKVIAKGLLNE